MNEMIYKSDAYKALKHEADMHMLPAYKEAYERAARIIDQMPIIKFESAHNGHCSECDFNSLYPTAIIRNK